MWEWCSSLYKPYPYGGSDGREDPGAGGVRVLRGGSWYDPRDRAGTSVRFRCDPDVRGGNLGFRLARTSE